MRTQVPINLGRPDLGRTVSLALLDAFLVVALVACGEVPRGIPLLPQNSAGSGLHQEGRALGGGLAVFAANPRYFADAGGRRAIYLTGSHTWNNFQDWGLVDPPHSFDYTAYLDFLEHYNHNFIRLYVWEQAAWVPWTEERIVIAPLPYPRTGLGRALDGGPQFDLTQFDPAYFRRLRERVKAAGARGIYVSVMLFNGWSMESRGKSGNPWHGHPFNRENNINGINGDVDGDGEGQEVHMLMNPAVTALQKTYLHKVVETLGDLDNVLWEISNESHPRSVDWQYEMIRTIKELELAQGKPHPVGMTSMWPLDERKNAPLFESPADWISPHGTVTEPYGDDPPASTGYKVIVSDTDHIWGIGGDPRWVWKSFLRGLNPIFMDPYVMALMNGHYPAWPPEVGRGTSKPTPSPEWEGIRMAMGYARAIADRVELAAMRPISELASTGHCLAAPGKEYLIYLPSQAGRLRRFIGTILQGVATEHFTVDLSSVQVIFDVEWVDVEHGLVLPGDPVTGGRRLEFQAPFAGDAVLHLKAREVANAVGDQDSGAEGR